MSNRVEDLERQVAELRATVDGLTEELVETKERLRQLEDAAVDDAAFEADAGGRSEAAATEDRRRADGADAGASADADADVDAAGEVEADKAAESETSDNEEESEGSDIIVA